MNVAIPTAKHRPLLKRLAEKNRASVAFTLDGAPATALDGDTILTAVLTRHDQLRRNEFSDAPRAGFCMMGACQDCWIATESGERLRACSTFIAPGMALLTGSDSLPFRGRAGVGADGVFIGHIVSTGHSPHPSLPPGGEGAIPVRRGEVE